MIEHKRKNFLCQFEYSSLYTSLWQISYHDSTFRDQHIHSHLFPLYLSSNSGSAAIMSELFCFSSSKVVSPGSVFLRIFQIVHRIFA